MPRSFFATAAATAVLTLGTFSLVPSAGQAQSVQPQSQVRNTQPQLRAAAIAKSGQFVTAEHETKGMAKIVTENGQRYLEFDGAFRSDDGPDLFVLLHRSSNPSSYRSEDFVRLGRLQSTSGKQRYAIPADVSISEFNSAVIWCRAFNATFGFAPLG